MLSRFTCGLLDLLTSKNIEIYTNMIIIGVPCADLWAKKCFGGGHLEFPILGGNRWNAVAVPVIFEICIPKTPCAKFRASFRKCTP